MRAEQNGGRVILVDDPSDPFTDSLAEALRARGYPVRRLPASQLAGLRVEVQIDRVLVEGRPLSALLFRASPHAFFGEGFAEGDSVFCSNEARATFLAVLHLPAVFVLNRPDAEQWYSASEWSLWRRRLKAEGVSVAPLVVGAPPADPGWRWLPWGGGVVRPPGTAVRRTFASALVDAGRIEQSICCCGHLIDGPDVPAVRRASEVLTAYGTGLASITSDTEGRVVVCTSHPDIPEPIVPRATDVIAEALYAHLHHR